MPLQYIYEDLTSWTDLRGVLQMAEALAEFGIPEELNVAVGVGFAVHEEVIHSRTGRLEPAKTGEPYRGRHNVALIGWDDQNREAVFLNSWGGAWGDRGVGYISEVFFDAHVDSVVVRRAAHVGPSRAMEEKMRAEAWGVGEAGRSTFARFLHSWTTNNVLRAKSVSVDGRCLDVLMRELLDLSLCNAFRALELRDGDELIARAHLQEASDGTGRVTEFWVPPVARRRGYGRYLEGEIVALCRAVGYPSLSLVLNEADASEVGIARARGFASALDYEIEFVGGRRPNTVATATKGCL